MNARLGAVLACGLAMPAMAQTIVNGNFDLEVPRTSFGNGWTGFSNDGAGGWRSSGGNPGGFFILNDGGSSASDPSISQILTDLIVGQQYEITGDYANWIATNTGPMPRPLPPISTALSCSPARAARATSGSPSPSPSSPTPTPRRSAFAARSTARTTTSR